LNLFPTQYSCQQGHCSSPIIEARIQLQCCNCTCSDYLMMPCQPCWWHLQYKLDTQMWSLHPSTRMGVGLGNRKVVPGLQQNDDDGVLYCPGWVWCHIPAGPVVSNSGEVKPHHVTVLNNVPLMAFWSVMRWLSMSHYVCWFRPSCVHHTVFFHGEWGITTHEFASAVLG